ncbi:MAG TPA: OmpH family outer membrane protein [Bacteroidales bacterium]|nr:OmpH family outer membrane protein [Bacteroidales bacterium]
MMNEEPIKENQEEIPLKTDEIHEETKETPNKCCNKSQCILTTISVLALIGVIVLFILFFLSGKKTAENTSPKTVDKVTFAYVNTDTIMEHYDFVLDVQVDLANYEKVLQNQYAARVKGFEKEYNDYIKRATAGLLTLDQQKKKEEELSKKQQEISGLESQLAMQLQEEKLKRNMEVHDTIVNNIARYNKTRNYTFIFEKSYGGGLLYVNDALDITSDILKSLNKEYEEIVKAKETEPEKAK